VCLLLALCVEYGRAATLTVQTNKIGATPESLAYNSGHFVPGSNTDDWWHYAGVSGARIFITPGVIEFSDDISGHGDGVTNQVSFVSRRAALRANPLSTSYINWNYLTPKFAATGTHGSNILNPNHASSRLRQLGVKILINLTASEGQFTITDENDWAGRWELWQHFYFEAFYFGREFDVERYQMYNEPDLNGSIAQPDYLPRLQLASDAVQSALADVNQIYGKSLEARVLAPVTAGAVSTTYSTWGRLIVTNRHINFLGEFDANFSLIGQYDYHEYNSTPATFGSRVAGLHSSLSADMSPEPRYPSSISEFNVHTAGTFDTMIETLDTPSKYSRFGAIVANLVSNSCNELYCFKFSQTGDATSVKKNGMHFVDNANSPYNIGGITKAGEVYRLFNKAAASGRDRLAVMQGSGATGLDVSATFDASAKRYHLFSANDSSDVDISLNLSAWNLPVGQRVLLEEVSENNYGGVKSLLTISNNLINAGTHGLDTVWLFSIPTEPQEPLQTLLASEDATVQDGTNRTLNFASNSVCLVENNSTNTSERSATFLKFHLPTNDLPDIQFALLVVRASSINGGNPVQAHVYGLINNNWSQTNITWSNAPNLKQKIAAGSSYLNNFILGQGTGAQMAGQFVANATAQDRMIDVTRFIREHPASDVSFLIAREVRFDGDIADADGMSIVSKEADANNGPRLLLVRTRSPDVALGINLSGTMATISWPTNSAGFLLEQSVSLSSPSWSVVTNTISTNGGKKNVTISAAAQTRFYRLKK
jgi:hypothetical protein